MSKKYDLAVPVDKYQKDGQDKTKWQNVGVILQTQNGFVMKLESLPLTVLDKDGNKVPFQGWINMFEPRTSDKPAAHPNQTGGIPKDAPPADEFQDIPFIDPYKFTWRSQ